MLGSLIYHNKRVSYLCCMLNCHLQGIWKEKFSIFRPKLVPRCMQDESNSWVYLPQGLGNLKLLGKKVPLNSNPSHSLILDANQGIQKKIYNVQYIYQFWHPNPDVDYVRKVVWLTLQNLLALQKYLIIQEFRFYWRSEIQWTIANQVLIIS